MLLLRSSSSRPVRGGVRLAINSARRRRSPRSRFITSIALRSFSSVIFTPKRRSNSALNLRSSCAQWAAASGSSGFCGSSRMYMGRVRPISSYIFFFPSQVVSATIRSAISMNGFDFST